jgi:hypothetical protein
MAVNHETYRYFEAQQRAEGGDAKWNPLNTTLDMGSQWQEAEDYNASHVRNYKYAIVGVVATILTFNQRNADGSLTYGTLLHNLRDENLTAEEIVNLSKADIKRWGTNPDLMLTLLKGIQ